MTLAVECDVLSSKVENYSELLQCNALQCLFIVLCVILSFFFIIDQEQTGLGQVSMKYGGVHWSWPFLGTFRYID